MLFNDRLGTMGNLLSCSHGVQVSQTTTTTTAKTLAPFFALSPLCCFRWNLTFRYYGTSSFIRTSLSRVRSPRTWVHLGQRVATWLFSWKLGQLATTWPSSHDDLHPRARATISRRRELIKLMLHVGWHVCVGLNVALSCCRRRRRHTHTHSDNNVFIRLGLAKITVSLWQNSSEWKCTLK